MTPEAVALIVAGLTTFVGALFGGVKMLRDGTGARQRDLMRDANKRGDREAHDKRQEQIQRRYFEQRCIALETGQKVPPLQPPVWVEWQDPDEKKAIE